MQKSQSMHHQSRQELRNLFRLEKIGSSLKVTVQAEDCDDSDCATDIEEDIEDVYLCASSVLTPHPSSLYIDFTAETVPSRVFHGLLDCGSTHCFADNGFVDRNKLDIYDIKPVRLHLFDG